MPPPCGFPRISPRRQITEYLFMLEGLPLTPNPSPARGEGGNTNMSTSSKPHAAHPQSFWLWVMCLTGVDYFSTLGYQPSIAFENAGLLAPLATIVLVAVTLFGALPIYWYVCGRSHTGQGSIGMLAKLVSGWG